MTHRVDYQHFPDSLKVIWVFDTHASLSETLKGHARGQILGLTAEAFASSVVEVADISRHVDFDSEEECQRTHGATGHFVYVPEQGTTNMAMKIESPCIASCRLQGGLCVDCGRSVEEIRRWKAMKRPERMATVKRAEQRRKKVDPD